MDKEIRDAQENFKLDAQKVIGALIANFEKPEHDVLELNESQFSYVLRHLFVSIQEGSSPNQILTLDDLVLAKSIKRQFFTLIEKPEWKDEYDERVQHLKQATLTSLPIVIHYNRRLETDRQLDETVYRAFLISLLHERVLLQGRAKRAELVTRYDKRDEENIKQFCAILFDDRICNIIFRNAQSTIRNFYPKNPINSYNQQALEVMENYEEALQTLRKGASLRQDLLTSISDRSLIATNNNYIKTHVMARIGIHFTKFFGIKFRYETDESKDIRMQDFARTLCEDIELNNMRLSQGTEYQFKEKLQKQDTYRLACEKLVAGFDQSHPLNIRDFSF